MEKQKKSIFKRVWFWVLMVLMAFVLGSCALVGAGAKSVSDEMKKGATTLDGKEQNEFKIGDQFNYNDVKFTSGNLGEVKGLTGTDVYTVFDITLEATKDNQTPFFTVQGIGADGNVVSSEIMFTSDNAHGEPVTSAWTKTLSKGQKTKGYVAFKKTSGVAAVEIKGSLKDTKVTIKM